MFNTFLCVLQQLKDESTSELRVLYSNGSRQDVVLRGVVLRPMVVVMPAEHRFGAVHVERHEPVTLYLSNPTEVRFT